VGKDRRTPETERYTVAAAADILGISTGAVRNRLSRGTLPSTKESGTVYVLLPADMSRDAAREAGDTPHGMPPPEPDTLTSELRDRLRYVEGQLEAERQAHAEARRLLMAALERIPPQLEAPSEPRETPTEGSRSTETPVEHPEGEEVWLDAEGREAQPREATESPSERPEAPETVEEQPERAAPRPVTVESQESVQRPWWRRVLGR
jgi:hypothetical protein